MSGLADNEPRDVIAALLQSWQGDDAGVFGMADQMVNKLRAEGYIITEASECPVCKEDIDPFCIKHGWNGQGVASFFTEAVKEGYATVDELLSAIGIEPFGWECTEAGDRSIWSDLDKWHAIELNGGEDDGKWHRLYRRHEKF